MVQIWFSSGQTIALLIYIKDNNSLFFSCLIVPLLFFPIWAGYRLHTNFFLCSYSCYLISFETYIFSIIPPFRLQVYCSSYLTLHVKKIMYPVLQVNREAVL